MQYEATLPQDMWAKPAKQGAQTRRNQPALWQKTNTTPRPDCTISTVTHDVRMLIFGSENNSWNQTKIFFNTKHQIKPLKSDQTFLDLVQLKLQKIFLFAMCCKTLQEQKSTYIWITAFYNSAQFGAI